jgi:hypothetical protein
MNTPPPQKSKSWRFDVREAANGGHVIHINGQVFYAADAKTIGDIVLASMIKTRLGA